MNVEQLEQAFLAHVTKVEDIKSAIHLLYWDMRTGAPEKGHTARTRIISQLSTYAYEQETADPFGEMITQLYAVRDTLAPDTQVILKEVKRRYERVKKVPLELHLEEVETAATAETVWERAKHDNDFQALAPYLEKLVDINMRIAACYDANKDAYDVLLDKYEPGMTRAKLDAIFSEVRARIVPLVRRIAQSEQRPSKDCLTAHFPKDRQRWFNRYLLEQLQFDLTGGRLDETEHPFMTTIHQGDIRVTTKYQEDHWSSAVFGTIHECGHARYEQNIHPRWQGTPIFAGASMGMHESQSLFYENIIGRSRACWAKHFPVLQDLQPETFKTLSLDEFYRSISICEPSFIRIEADEVTYALHIMVRYELEKELFSGALTVQQLPDRWNALMTEYLGVTPPTDTLGVLQDVHWPGGSFGYFPSYALGYMYAAQMRHTIEREIGSIETLIAEGDEYKIFNWLKTHVQEQGASQKPEQIIQAATGETLNPTYFCDYLERKYTAIYG
ncbi:MAG: carboxypeptidase M32 [Bacilli bacterium]